MNAIDPAASSLTPRQLQTIRTQAEELEGVFLNMLTKEMFASIKGDENFGGGFGEAAGSGDAGFCRSQSL